jgi:hypothetical protein
MEKTCCFAALQTILHGARFPTENYTRECHWFPCLLVCEANRRVTNGIPLGCPLFLPVHTVKCVQTLKASADDANPDFEMDIFDEFGIADGFGTVDKCWQQVNEKLCDTITDGEGAKACLWEDALSVGDCQLPAGESWTEEKDALCGVQD